MSNPTMNTKKKIEGIKKAIKASNDAQYEMYHGHKRPTPEPSDWEREFDREFTSENKNMSRKETMLFEPTTSKIKSFISTLLTQKEKTLIEKVLVEVENTYKDMYPQDRNLTFEGMIIRLQYLNSLKRNREEVK